MPLSLSLSLSPCLPLGGILIFVVLYLRSVYALHDAPHILVVSIIMIVKMLRFMLIIIMAGTCHMPRRLRGLAWSFMACWFLFDTHKYGDQMELAMRRSS